MPIVLRPFQQDLKDGIYRLWNSSVRNVLAVLATGGGKSVLVSDIVLDGYNANMMQVVIAHRNELVGQMSKHLANRGIYHRIISNSNTVKQIIREHREEFGQSFVNHRALTAVIGVDTLISRQSEFSAWLDQVDRWIIDEAHHCVGNENTDPNKWGKAIKMFPNAHGLGVTATPERADGLGLGSHADGPFDYMLEGPTMRWLIDNGYLSDYVIVCPESDLYISDDDIGKTGDFGKQKLKSASQRSQIVGDVVENYCKHAFGKRAICFATDVETSNKIADKFVQAGIPAASLSAKTNPAVREKYIKDFRNGRIWVLVNVDLFDEGFDVPACEVVIMARPTASLGKYLQMIGRALRVMDGKTHAIIIDHVSNWKRHKLPDLVRKYTLDRREKNSRSTPDPDNIELTKCKTCTRPYEAFRTFCPHCGAVPPLPDPKSRTIEMVAGDLILLDREKLDEMRRAAVLESPADIGQRVAKAAGPIAGKSVINSQIEKIGAHKDLQEAIAQWAAIERQKGHSDSEIHRKFYLTMGQDVLSSLSADKKRQDYENLTNIVKGWYHK